LVLSSSQRDRINSEEKGVDDEIFKFSSKRVVFLMAQGARAVRREKKMPVTVKPAGGYAGGDGGEGDGERRKKVPGVCCPCN
jgi:hypothetical protein